MKQGFQVMDSDMHVIEPMDLFEKYLDRQFRPRAPKIVRPPGQRYSIVQWMGHAIPS